MLAIGERPIASDRLAHARLERTPVDAAERRLEVPSKPGCVAAKGVGSKMIRAPVSTNALAHRSSVPSKSWISVGRSASRSRCKPAVDEHERHPRRFVGIVDPGVVGAALDHDIARAERGLAAVVEDEGHDTRQHDPVVERLRTVHRRARGGGEVDDPDHGPVRVRRCDEGPIGGLSRLCGRKRCGRVARAPKLVEGRSRDRVRSWRRPVGNDDRSVLARRGR